MPYLCFFSLGNSVRYPLPTTTTRFWRPVLTSPRSLVIVGNGHGRDRCASQDSQKEQKGAQTVQHTPQHHRSPPGPGAPAGTKARASARHEPPGFAADDTWEADPRNPPGGAVPPRRRRSPSSLVRDLTDTWFRLTAPPVPPLGAGFAARERARRGHLASTLLLLVLLLWFAAFPEALASQSAANLPIFGIGLLVIGGALLLNRLGAVAVVALLLIASIDVGYVAILVSAHATLDLLVVPVFDLLVYAVLIAVSLLPPALVFLVALSNMVLIVGAVYLRPHTPEFDALLQSGHIDGILVQPITLQLAVALVTYLWVRSAVQAIRRADRAEEMALLEARERDRVREIDEGVRQLLDVHVRVANGDFHVQVPVLRSAPLWQVGNSLNRLIARMARLAQADFTLRREQEEAQRLVAAIDAWGRGQLLLWPAPTGLPLDGVIEALRELSRRGGGPRSQLLGSPPSHWLPGAELSAPPLAPPTPLCQPAWQSEAAPELPEWLRPAEQGDSPGGPAGR